MNTVQEVLKISNISKSFGTLSVLKDISFSVYEGHVLGIIGSSGSGKSTLLRCICQLESPDSGSIFVTGQNIIGANKKTQRELLLKTGFVFQNFNLFPHFSVLRNITEAQIHVLGKSRAQAETQAHMLLAKMGLSEKKHSYPFELSGGQQQRVSIARALALEPQVLCFDEPTSALDPELTGEILKVIRELALEHMTMLVVTHEMSFARDIADHIIFMDDGLIIEEGGADDIINHPKHERTKAFLSRYTHDT